MDNIPAGLRWDINDAEKHHTRRTFIRVGGDKLNIFYLFQKKDKKQRIFDVRTSNINTRILSGATRSWSLDDPEENETVFCLTYRITGTPKNITLAMRLCEPSYSYEQIAECLADAITKDNYQTTKKEEYDRKIIEYEETL